MFTQFEFDKIKWCLDRAFKKGASPLPWVFEYSLNDEILFNITKRHFKPYKIKKDIISKRFIFKIDFKDNNFSNENIKKIFKDLSVKIKEDCLLNIYNDNECNKTVNINEDIFLLSSLQKHLINFKYGEYFYVYSLNRYLAFNRKKFNFKIINMMVFNSSEYGFSIVVDYHYKIKKVLKIKI